MTEPPTPLPEDRPRDHGPPAYGPPTGYGAYGQPYPPPPSPYHEQPGMAGWSKVLIGAVLGMVGGVIVLVAVLLIIASTVSSDTSITGEMVFALCVLVPTLLPVPMLFFRVTRMWAVGLMIGAGLSTIVLAGACAYIIQGLTEGSA